MTIFVIFFIKRTYSFMEKEKENMGGQPNPIE